MISKSLRAGDQRKGSPTEVEEASGQGEFQCMTTPNTAFVPRELPRLVRVADAARELSVSERHLREQLARGRIPVVRIGKSVRLARETVERIARDGLTS